MSIDQDSYLLKCILEGLETKESPEVIEEICACSLGLESNYKLINTGE